MSLYDERLRLATDITSRLIDLYAEAIHAVGLHGSMAHGEIDERSDLDFAVVTGEAGTVPERYCRVDGVLVSLGVITQARYLELAARIGPDWSVSSDEYLHTLALHDPEGFFELLRDAHLRSVDSAPDQVFVQAARSDLLEALEWLDKGDRCWESGSPAAATICLDGALVDLALAIGLLTRTRWRGRHLAVAAAIDAGTFVEGFRGPYVNACRAEDALSERLQAARHATGALRWHLSEAGAETEVVSVEELLPSE